MTRENHGFIEFAGDDDSIMAVNPAQIAYIEDKGTSVKIHFACCSSLKGAPFSRKLEGDTRVAFLEAARINGLLQ